jgi:hypothetical protein
VGVFLSVWRTWSEHLEIGLRLSFGYSDSLIVNKMPRVLSAPFFFFQFELVFSVLFCVWFFILSFSLLHDVSGVMPTSVMSSKPGARWPLTLLQQQGD